MRLICPDKAGLSLYWLTTYWWPHWSLHESGLPIILYQNTAQFHKNTNIYKENANLSIKSRNLLADTSCFCNKQYIYFFFYLRIYVSLCNISNCLTYPIARERKSLRRRPWLTWGWTQAAGWSDGPWRRTDRTPPSHCCDPNTSPASSTWPCGSETRPADEQKHDLKLGPFSLFVL